MDEQSAGGDGHLVGPAVVVDRLQVDLPQGARVVVCSDLHLSASPDETSALLVTELVAAIRQIEGPGAVVLNGDCFELLSTIDPGVGRILDAHPAFTEELRALSVGPDRHVVVIAGNHDGRLAWDADAAAVLADRIGARVCLGADLVLATAKGPRVVQVEHGNSFDPANAFDDPRNPLDSPLGHHVVREVLPEITARPALADAGSLADPADFPRLLGSRVVYRTLAPRWWVLAVPFAAALALRLPFIAQRIAASDDLGRAGEYAGVASAFVIVDVLLLLLVGILVARRVFASLAETRFAPAHGHRNDAPRAAAEALCSAGFAGLVTGHTHRPELTPLGGGFYANTGCGVDVLVPQAARFGLPPVFAGLRRRSWLRLDAGHDLEARLFVGESPLGRPTLAERLARRPVVSSVPTVPEAVAVVPGGAGYPIEAHPLQAQPERLKARRWAAGLVVVSALLSLLSALTPPLFDRLDRILHKVPVDLPQVLSTALVFGAIGLLLLSRGLRRGQWHAWLVTVVLLGVTALLNLGKGGDIEEAAVAVAVALWLVVKRRFFTVRPDRAAVRRAVVLGAVLPLGALAVSLVLVWLAGARRGVRESARALAERLAGDHALPLPVLNGFVTPALLAAGIGTVVVVGWVLFGPHGDPKRTDAQRAADRERARAIVREHGGDTLAYFALRDDKDYFFSGSSVVAYSVRNGVCLVSPDPVGPDEERADVWSDFTSWTDANGWSVAIMGSHEGWLSVYRAAGMRSVYLGDEAIVDCQRFTLDGGRMKSVRTAFHRVTKAGYRVEMYDPARLDPALQAELVELMTETRKGEVERGFSMTLGRIFDPRDDGLLLAVAFDGDGRAAAFCQFVPAGDIDGYSLDLMRRRADPDLPNGVTDVVVIETIRYLKEQHRWGLCLNFAVLRAVVAGEAQGRPFGELERRVLKHFGQTMQIESLWRYNEKFRPFWRPRYVVVDAVENLPSQGVAIADAESIWELPVIGRFLKPSREAKAPDVTPAPALSDA